MQRNAALAVGALAGAAAAFFLRRRPRTEPGAAPREMVTDQAEELRRKLAEARVTQADEDDFEAAGMGAETIVTEEPRARAAAPGTTEPASGEPPPSDEFEAMRRRVHEEGRAAAEEMRRRAEAEESPP
jgi:hypothetical protein